MNFGLILTGENPKPWQVSSAQLYRSMVQQAVLAEELGYDSVWTAEHHGTDEYWPSQFPVLAAIAARTSRIRVGTYIVILPLYHPLQVARKRPLRSTPSRTVALISASDKGTSSKSMLPTASPAASAHHAWRKD